MPWVGWGAWSATRCVAHPEVTIFSNLLDLPEGGRKHHVRHNGAKCRRHLAQEHIDHFDEMPGLRM